MPPTAQAPDFMTLEELSLRLKLSEKTLKRMHRDRGLPLFRLVENGPLFGFWSEAEAWVRKNRIQDCARKA